MDRVNELNYRIASRNIPSEGLNPQFSCRPQSTKYAFMPILDTTSGSKMQQDGNIYNVSRVFNPGNAQAPWSGFASNINRESSLRNQFFALQKCEQSEWVPSSRSDLYNSHKSESNIGQPFPGLFKRNEFNKFNPNECGLGMNLWGNSTRYQVRNIIKK